MCVRIALVDVLPEIAIWDPDEVTILVRRGTHPRTAVTELRAILSDLGAPHISAFGLFCFCGEPTPLPHGLSETRPKRAIPMTRRQVLRGA